jgi:DNA replication protein DnaC
MTKKTICARCNGDRYCLAGGKGGWRLCDCFQCDQCNGGGYVYNLDDKGLSYASACECARFKNKLKKLNQSGIPEKFARVSFESYSAPGHPSQKLAKTRAMDFVADFSPSSSRGLLFMGEPGLGKTHLAIALIKSLIMEKGVDCKFVDFFQLLSDIRNGFSNDISEQTLINPYVKSQVLVIDELAKGRNTEWELTILDQIISIRYNAANKITLFTTNYMSELSIKNKADEKSAHVDFERQNFSDLLTTQTLQERIGPRIYSRLAEMCDFVMMQGEDHRQQKLPKPQRFSKAKK